MENTKSEEKQQNLEKMKTDVIGQNNYTDGKEVFDSFSCVS